MAEANEPDSDNHSLHAQDDDYCDDESVHAARSQHNLSQLEIDIRVCFKNTHIDFNSFAT